LRIALIETTGTLGREITSAYNSFVDVPGFAGVSDSLSHFCDSLYERKGVFGRQIDPTVAAVAFDAMLEPPAVDVLFHVWPVQLLTDGGKVVGLEVACRSGLARLDAPKVIDASMHGKIGKAWFKTSPAAEGGSSIQLLYIGVTGECPKELELTLPNAGQLSVVCRPTFWPNEWRVIVRRNGQSLRSDWQLQLEELLGPLCERIPALRSGVLAHLADDVWGEPALQIAASSADHEVVGHVMDPNDEPNLVGKPFAFPIERGMLCNPAIVDGLFLAGPWLAHYPFDSRKDQTAIVNAFVLGDLVAHTAIQQA
jgi:hypothetical protein